MTTADKRLQDDVINELNWEPGVDAAHIGVTAQDGSVTLTGHVPSYVARTRAVKAAERVYAVRAVADDLEVRLPSSQTHDDTTIAEALAHTLRWNVAVPHDVHAKVSKGWVTLTGTVDKHFQKQAAERAIEYQSGVRGITNLIDVRHQTRPGDIQKMIAAAFQRHASLDASQIQVESDDGTVHLRGKVHSASEARVARATAYAAPGVKSVDDRLMVVP